MGKALRLSLPVFTRSTGRRRVYMCVYVRGPFMYWSMFSCLVGPSARAGTGRGRLWMRLRLLWCWGSASSWPQCCGGGRLDCRCQYLSHSLVLIEKGLGDAVRAEHLLPNHGSVPLVRWDYALHTSVLILPGPEEPLLAVRT